MANIFNQIIPDDLRQIIIDEGRNLSESFWNIGDSALLVNAAVEAAQRDVLAGTSRLASEDAEAVMRIGVMDVYEEVASLAGMTARAVREITPVCEFFNESMRFPYSETLRFGHFQYAQHYPDHWRKMLDACLDYASEHGGQIPSVSWLQRQFYGESHQVVNQIHDFNDEFAMHEASTDAIGFDNPDVEDSDDRFMININPVIVYLRKLERYIKDDSLRAKVGEALRLLSDVISQLDSTYKIK